MIGTMALIIVLSVFNGLEKLVVSLYNSFDAEIKITVNEGKYFNANEISDDDLKKIKGVRYVTHVIEENAGVIYKDRKDVITIKGVDSDFVKMAGLDSMIIDGSLTLQSDYRDTVIKKKEDKKGDTVIFENVQKNFAVVGQGVAGKLGVHPDDYDKTLQVYVPRRGKYSTNDPEAINQLNIVPSGVFAIEQDFDSHYIIVPLRFTKELFETDTSLTAIEIGLEHGTNLNDVQKHIKKLVGNKFDVKNRFQQRETLYKILSSEKWAIYLILSFILIIATFNIIGSLTMLIIDKRDDITILHHLGADNNQIKKIFFYEGIMITLSGAVTGLLLGLLICWAQQTFGLVKLSGSGNFIIKYYPVHLEVLDFIYVFLTVFIIGWFASWVPSRQVIKRMLNRQIQEA